MKKDFAAIILAAGKGKRMESKEVNKVALNLANKPMILHSIHLLQDAKINTIVVVIGFAKESVKRVIKENVIFAEQNKRLGTAHAVSVAIKKIPQDIYNVLVLNGDDSAFYTKDLIEKLIEKHLVDNSSLTFLTIEKD